MPDLKAEDVAKKAMEIAAEMCVYTNTNFRCEILEAKEDEKKK
jgi:ATP-dependent protease HslVU (ClpYQ) peptidase subunit